MRFKEGDYVRIVEREATPGDAKSGLYYPYFCGLAGTVDRICGKEVCVNVDLEALPEDVMKRHKSIQESMRRKWLNGLSNEVRNKLPSEEKRFDLAYRILVHSTDLQKAKKGEPRPVAIESVRPIARAKSAVVEKPVKKKAAPKQTAKTAKPSVRTSGVEKASAKAPDKGPKTAAKPVAKAALATKPSRKGPGKSQPAPKSRARESSGSKKGIAGAEGLHPVTSADLTAAEKAFLKERQKALKAKK